MLLCCTAFLRFVQVSNIPLVPGIPPPPELFEINQLNVFALTIDPSTLESIRIKRFATLGLVQEEEKEDGAAAKVQHTTLKNPALCFVHTMSTTHNSTPLCSVHCTPVQCNASLHSLHALRLCALASACYGQRLSAMLL